MPDNDDLRMNQNETLNCSRPYGRLTGGVPRGRRILRVNPDGSGTSRPSPRRRRADPGTLAVDGSGDEMTTPGGVARSSTPRTRPTSSPATRLAAKAYVKQYVVDSPTTRRLPRARTNSSCST